MPCPKVTDENHTACENWLKPLLPIELRSVAIYNIPSKHCWHANCNSGPTGSNLEALEKNTDFVRATVQSATAKSASLGVLSTAHIWAPRKLPIWQFTFYPK